MKVLLETERMVLRPLETADIENLLGIFSDREAMRYYPRTKDRREAEGWVRWNRESYRRNGYGLWAAILKDSGEFAGQCGLVGQEVEGKNEVEIGYMFLKKLWERGLATEAARACRDHGFDVLGYGRLVSLIDPENLASRRVAEKVGITLEKRTHKWGKTICVYSVATPTVTKRSGSPRRSRPVTPSRPPRANPVPSSNGRGDL